MPKKKTSDQMIEELALMVGKGFEAVTKEMRDGFVAIDRRLERVEFNTAGLERRVETAEDRIVQLARKVGLEFR